jgi:phenylalanyl-tRNA synthetase alpha subunit
VPLAGFLCLGRLRIGLDDIRKLYLSDIDWLKGATLCR